MTARTTEPKPTRRRKPARRTRSPHPGVVLIKPDPAGRHHTWRARYTDPDTGKVVKARLDPLGLPTAATRRDWAITKAKALAKRRMELASGAPRATGTALPAAVKRYFEAHPGLRPRTRAVYRDAANKLERWAANSGVHSVDELNRAALLGLRASLAKERKKVAARSDTRPTGTKAKRGEFKPTKRSRSPHTINRELRAIRTVLGYLTNLDLFPRLTHDDLRYALRRFDAPVERVDYLKPTELQALLNAALRHDSETYTETRDEHRGKRPKGTTPRYDPIAPFIATTLLTGMRFGEAIELEWRQVDLEALDSDGRKVGEIYLSGATKTKRARTVGLEVSPELRKLLAAMKLRAGGKGRVFAMTAAHANAAAKRLRQVYGAPKRFTWQTLRRTCGTYLTNAPGIFGAASAYRSAKQLGHSVQVAEQHYVDVLRGIPKGARTLERAMQIEPQVRAIIGASRAHPKPRVRATRATGTKIR